MILGVTVRDSSRCKPFGRKPLGVNGRADFNCNDDVGPTAPAGKQLQSGKAGKADKAGKTVKAAKADKQLHVVSYPGL